MADGDTKDTFISQNQDVYTSLDASREKSCLDKWILSFNHSQKKGHKFLDLRIEVRIKNQRNGFTWELDKECTISQGGARQNTNGDRTEIWIEVF